MSATVLAILLLAALLLIQRVSIIILTTLSSVSFMEMERQVANMTYMSRFNNKIKYNCRREVDSRL